MTMAELNFITPAEVKQYHIGALLESGDGYLDGDKHATVAQWLERLDQYYLASVDSRDGGVNIPILWGTDAVHGHSKVIGATIFPHNIALGATRNAELVRQVSAATALETRVLGKDWTFAPEVSVTRDDRWGRTYEGYGEDAQWVAKLGQASIEGLQGQLGSQGQANAHFMNGKQVMATAKHYIGDGGTENGVDRANNSASEKDLIATHAPGYFTAVQSGVLSIMASHSSWQNTRMHGHDYLINTILKERLGFDGFVVGDWDSHALIPGCTNINCPAAAIAGLDMFMVPIKWKGFIETTVQQVKDGVIPEARINDAVTRILRAKYRAGLMDETKPSARAFAGKTEFLGSPEHIALARQAVRESAVLLKNNNKALPLNPASKVLVVGRAASDIGQQTGGWTLSWQGTGNKLEDFPKAQTILQGIEAHVKNAGGKFEYAANGNYSSKAGGTKPDVAIMVFGEQPYAEWFGDIKTLAWQPLDHTDALMLEKLKADGIKVISVFLSGRPLWLNREINASDAFIAAWQPGTQGAGISDLLFTDNNGKIAYDFTGKLPLSWPKFANQYQLNIGDKNYDPLFPFGYGLSYAKPGKNLPKLDDAIGNALDGIALDTPLLKATAIAPWQLTANGTTYQGKAINTAALSLAPAQQEGEDNVSLVSTSAVDFSEHLTNNAVIVFDFYRQSAATQPVYAEFSDGTKSHKIDISEKFNAAPLNNRNRLSIDTLCLKEAGLDLSHMTQSFSLVTSGTLNVNIANIQIEPEMADKGSYRCRAN
jgi:beta-glucosidase